MQLTNYEPHNLLRGLAQQSTPTSFAQVQQDIGLLERHIQNVVSSFLIFRNKLTATADWIEDSINHLSPFESAMIQHLFDAAHTPEQ